MRRLLLCGALLWVSAAPAEMTGQQRAQAAGRALIGSPAPRLALKTIDGDTTDLGSLYGKKAVYLKFWATWCVPCRQQMPHFEHAYETAGAELAVIAIDVGFNDSIDAIRAYRQKLGITMPIVFDDGRLGAAFRLRVTPTHIVVGRDGRIQYVGHLADQALDAALLAARSPAARPSGARARGGSVPTADEGNAGPPAAAVGDLLPARSVQTLDGRRFEFRRGAPPNTLTVLVFLSPWCESYLASTRPETAANCRSARTQFSELSADPRVRWLGIASGLWANTEDLKRYRKDYGVTIPLTLDASGDAYRMFRVNDIPTLLVADSGGRIVRRIEGTSLKDAAALRMALDSSGNSRQ